ncbi:hypothetical protein AYO44_03275 [Planctomycetaceae bacterium SCGC AG-212-F19]|nr:hypothetical protein AYO44_03275 [Planctomycetaceae bacterium SCGC AG-212-F19]
MAQAPISQLVGYLRRLVRMPAGDALTDRLLLERFVACHDEAAFAELVGRHGAMVLGVCHRVLRDDHAAEDAFQAVFLVLARKAGAVGWQDSIASWLYAVAYRTAQRSRANARRRREQERQASSMADPEALAAVDARELRALLDEELLRLPEKYRAPLVLCYLEGKTNEEAARLLGWSKGTVSGRLARARDMLGGRLRRRGVMLSAGGLVAIIAEQSAIAAAVPRLAAETARAAVSFAGLAAPGAVPASLTSIALAEGVLHAMFLSRLRVAAMLVLALFVFGGGIALVGRPVLNAQAPNEVPPTPAQPAAAAEEPPAKPADSEQAPADPLTIEPLDYINRVHVQFSETQRFGLVCPRLRDPRNPNRPKLLTRDERGITNNTCVRIEGYEYLFGVEIPGVRYVKENGKVMKEVPIPDKDRDRAWQSVWESEFGKIRITQSVEIIVGEQTRLYDTVLVRYQVWNRDKPPRTVGLRVMLDTFIGTRDGVPFYVPPSPEETRLQAERAKLPKLPPERIAQLITDLDSNSFDVRDNAAAELAKHVHVAQEALRKALQANPALEVRRRIEQILEQRGQSGGWVETMRVFDAKSIPPFVQALESADLSEPKAALAVLCPKIRECEPPSKMVICRWPQNSEARWGGTNAPGDWQYEPIDKNPNAPDSCVVLYWQQVNMKPNEKRELAFTYGLGRVLADVEDPAIRPAANGKMRLFSSPGATTARPFPVIAYYNGRADAKLKLTLPAGLELAPGEEAEQAVGNFNRAGYGQVTWRVRATKPGTYAIEATGTDIGLATEVIRVREKSLFE